MRDFQTHTVAPALIRQGLPPKNFNDQHQLKFGEVQDHHLEVEAEDMLPFLNFSDYGKIHFSSVK
jgi:hypothetical protein